MMDHNFGLLATKPGSRVFLAEGNSKPMGESLNSILTNAVNIHKELSEVRIIFEPSILGHSGAKQKI